MILPTPRQRMSKKRRHHIFTENCTAHDIAPCCLCGEPIHRRKDDWQIEHVRALGLLGKDTNTNCRPAHTLCAIEKTQKHDLPMIRKAKRQAEAATPREGMCVMHTPKTKKPARGFQVPAGYSYNWRAGRYERITA
jgi:hypothetical protein